jgi:hypothetical protein
VRGITAPTPSAPQRGAAILSAVGPALVGAVIGGYVTLLHAVVPIEHRLTILEQHVRLIAQALGLTLPY